MCITSKTAQPILGKSGVCDIRPLVCLFVCDILFANLVRRSCNQPAACTKCHSCGIASEETQTLWNVVYTSLPRMTPHGDSAIPPITARVHSTACVFVQQQSPITSSKEQWEQQEAENSRKTCSLTKLSFYGFKNLHGFIMPKSSEELFNRRKSGSILQPTSRA